MYDFRTYKSAEENPSASKAFVQTLTPYELLQILDNSPDNSSDDFDARKYIIDCDAVIDGIIESGCEGKLLLVAARSDLGSWGRCERLINDLFSKGNAFQSALLSNPRINWYLFFMFDESGFIDRNLDIIIANSNLATAFYKNPRMDRGLIAQIIRCRKVKFKSSSYDFSKITPQQRIQAAYYSLPVREIATNYDDIGSSFGGPSANTTDFHKPVEASLFLLKDLSKKMSHDELSRRLTCLNPIFPKARFSYDIEDWLTKAEYDELFNDELFNSEDFESKYDKAHNISMGRIFVFFDELTQSPVNYS